ncbi:MAG: hypothetical protein GY861_24880 [bacterium]|nr:hypothetical protein [bacterium]
MSKTGIALIGPYFSGKTSCSKLIGAKAGYTVLDLDEMYTAKFNESIWATRNLAGEDLAKERRDNIAEEILEKMCYTPSVVVFGGGSAFRDHPEWVEKVKESHLVVCLNPTRQTLVDRALHDKTQPENQFVFRDSTADSIERYFEEYALNRGADYLTWADRIVEPGSDWATENVCFHILAAHLKEINK